MWKLLLGERMTFLLLKKIEFGGIEQEKEGMAVFYLNG